MPPDRTKTGLWRQFQVANQVVKQSVPLFATENSFVKVIEYGRDNRKVLARSSEMEKLMRNLGNSLAKQHEAEAVKSSGILYMMFRQQIETVIPMYIGKAEIYGKRNKNLSANISDLISGNGKFGRWGYNYAYHLGDLSAVTLPGHSDTKKTKKYSDWRDSLFEIKEEKVRLKGDIRFWACNWDTDRQSIWREYGPTRLAFEEYLLIGVASDLFPNDLLNREGRNR